jgi:hypothetical protein
VGSAEPASRKGQEQRVLPNAVNGSFLTVPSQDPLRTARPAVTPAGLQQGFGNRATSVLLYQQLNTRLRLVHPLPSVFPRRLALLEVLEDRRLRRSADSSVEGTPSSLNCFANLSSGSNRRSRFGGCVHRPD